MLLDCTLHYSDIIIFVLMTFITPAIFSLCCIMSGVFCVNVEKNYCSLQSTLNKVNQPFIKSIYLEV